MVVISIIFFFLSPYGDNENSVPPFSGIRILPQNSGKTGKILDASGNCTVRRIPVTNTYNRNKEKYVVVIS